MPAKPRKSNSYWYCAFTEAWLAVVTLRQPRYRPAAKWDISYQVHDVLSISRCVFGSTQAHTICGHWRHRAGKCVVWRQSVSVDVIISADRVNCRKPQSLLWLELKHVSAANCWIFYTGAGLGITTRSNFIKSSVCVPPQLKRVTSQCLVWLRTVGHAKTKRNWGKPLTNWKCQPVDWIDSSKASFMIKQLGLWRDSYLPLIMLHGGFIGS